MIRICLLNSFYGFFYVMLNEYWFYGNIDVEKMMYNREFCRFFLNVIFGIYNFNFELFNYYFF